MAVHFDQLSELIANRRAVFPKVYIEKEIPDELILQILENANWAPTHRKTEPWRFKIFKGESLKQLSEFFLNHFQKNNSDMPESKMLRKANKPLKSACVIALVMHRDPEERVPEWEELAALACAVQNMWLSCTSLGIGSYWSSPSSIHSTRELLGLKSNEKCYGFFYMGYYDTDIPLEGERTPIEEKLEWM